MISTEELMHRIKEEKTGDMSFLEKKEFDCPDITVYLCDLLAEHKKEVKEVIRQLGLERTYGYQMFNGTRKPTRNFLIRLAVLLGLTVEETNRLLKIGKKEILYPRIKEDAVVIYAIEKKLPLEELEEILEEL